MRENPRGSWRIFSPPYARIAILLLLGSALTAGGVDAGTVTLRWTAPAENGAEGGAADYYRMRYAEAAVGADTAAWWDGAAAVGGLPDPGAPGSTDSATVSGLEPGRTYWFCMRSGDEADNLSGFSVPLAVDVPDSSAPPAPLVLSDVAVETWWTDSVLVSWRTDRPATGRLRYGPDDSYGFERVLASPATEQSVWLESLPEGEEIHFRVFAADGAASDSTADSVFLAPDPPPSRIDSVRVMDGVESASLIWTASVETDYARYLVYRDGMARAADPVLLACDFDDGAPGSDPAGFVETDSAGAHADRFHLEAMAGRGLVLRGSTSGGASRLLYGGGDWSDYEATGSFRFSGDVGADLLLRAGAVDAYRIGRTAEGGPRVAGEGGAAPVRTGGAHPALEENRWYRFRVIAWERGGVLRLEGSLWPEGEEEPERFAIRAADGGASRPESGSFGFRIAGNGDVWFDDLSLRRLPAGAEPAVQVFPFLTQNDLDPDSSYHYWLLAEDGAGNAGAPAGPFAALPAAPETPDTVAPAAVGDLLVAAGPGEGEARLFWTAPGDDGDSGTAASYDIRWAADTLHEGNWSGASPLAGGSPGAAGTPESLLVTGLPAGADRRFALITADEAGNASALSNRARYLVPGDTEAPVLADIRAGEVSAYGARIDWDLNEPATGRVEYGLTKSYEIGSEGEDARVLHHHIVLHDLLPSTEYHYRVRSADPSGNEAVSGDRVFTTDPPPSPEAPVLSGIAVEAVSDSDAVILFSTDPAALGFVDFGPDGAYGFTAGGETTAAAHRIRLAPLAHGEVYHFRARAVGEGGETVSGDRTFSTLVEQTVPVISGVTVTVTDSSARIAWETDEGAAGSVEYGPTDGYGLETERDSSFRYDHEALLSGLAPESVFHFRVHAEDRHGNAAVTADSFFLTAAAPDLDAPDLAEFRVEEITHASAAVLWSTDEPAFGSLRIGLTPVCEGDTLVSEEAKREHRFELAGLPASTRHYLRAAARDGNGNIALSDTISFLTAAAPDTAAPVIHEVRVESAGVEAATLAWRTDESASCGIAYGLHSAAEESLLTASWNEEHSLRLDELAPGGVYLYRVFAVDGAGNRSATGVDTLFLAAPDTTAPAVRGLAIVPDGAEAVLLTWRSDEPAFAFVEYGPDSAYGASTATEADPDTLHQARIDGLVPGEANHFRVTQEDSAGNVSRSGDTLFTLPAPDLTGPAVVQTVVTGVDASKATVFWSTDEASCGRVLFGRTAACGDSTPVDSVLGKEHTRILDGLDPLTRYYFRICCSDTAGNPTVTGVDSFLTAAPEDSTPPRFHNVELADLGGGAARFRWETDEPSAGWIEYGADSTLGGSEEKRDVFSLSHSFLVDGLETGRVYFFRGSARDSAGNEGLTEILALFLEESGGEETPALDIRVEAGIRDAAVIWETGGPTNARVEYGADPSCPHHAENDSLLTAHRIVLTGLEPSTFYHYRISGADGDGHLLDLDGLGFRTLPDTLPEVGAMAAVPGERSARLFWTVDRFAAGSVEIAAGNDPFRTAAAGSLFAREHADSVDGLDPGTTYRWRIRGVTRAGVEFLSRADSFRTADDVTPPAPPLRLTGRREGGAVALSWESAPGERPDSLYLHRRLLPGGEWTVVWAGEPDAMTHVDPIAESERAAFEKAEYRIEAVDGSGNRSRGETFTVEIALPAEILLLPNRPNPFNPTTTIAFELPAGKGGSLPVRLAVYNIRGEEVRLLVDETLPADRRHEVVWDGTDYRGNPVASGSYHYRLTAPDYSETRKMILIR